MKFNQPLLTRKNIIIGLITVAVIYAVVSIIIFIGGRDKVPNREEFNPGYAYITNDDELLSTLGDDTQYLGILEDLDVFANKSLGSSRTTESRANIFTINGKVKFSDQTVSFEGGFDGIKGKLRVVAKKLSNSRLSTSITGDENIKNVDSELPSNSKKNQFIATLPIINNSYGIYYYSDTDKISVEVFVTYTLELKKTILDLLRSSTGVDFLDQEDYDIYYYPPSDLGLGSAAMVKDETPFEDVGD